MVVLFARVPGILKDEKAFECGQQGISDLADAGIGLATAHVYGHGHHLQFLASL
jgi:hypothetical protein